MYRSSQSSCPACSVGLVPLEPSPVVAHVCPACGGTWLGQEASIHIMRGLGDPATVELTKATDVAARRASVSPAADAGGRACPTCAAPLMPMSVSDVVVDTCPAHGTWFDRDEVSRVARACKKLRETGDSESSGTEAPITFEGVIEGTAQIGYGITKAAVTLVLDLFGAIEDRERRAAERERMGR